MARLREEYNKKIKQEVMKDLGYKNPMQVPTLEKIVVNMGVGEVIANHSALEEIIEMFRLISGQNPVVNKAKKAISSFKIRQGQDVGVSVTLRGARMWEFFDKLVNVVFPRTKDFRGLKASSFDGSGNFSVGIEDHTVFVEIDPNQVSKVRSLQVTIVTTADNDKDAKVFLDKFGFPFVKDVNRS